MKRQDVCQGVMPLQTCSAATALPLTNRRPTAFSRRRPGCSTSCTKPCGRPSRRTSTSNAARPTTRYSSRPMTMTACLQHCKRDFVDMTGNPDADEILGLANDLYESEHKHKVGRDGWTSEDNLKWRQEYAAPILEKLKAALLRVQAQTDKYPPRSQMRGAVNYFLNEWDGIEAIPTAGDYAWDNNQIEGINRYVSLSRKNFLFFGSHAGAERGCIFYSLACSCRLHRINFFEYLSDVLNLCAEMPNGAPPEAFRNLLPDRWTKKEQGE